MRIDGRLPEAARAFRRRWPSAAAWGAAVLIVALLPLPTEGHSALAFIAGAGLGGEILEQVLRVSLCAAYRSIRKIVRDAGVPRCTGRG